MRTFALALASLAVIGLSAPVGTTPANAETVKKVIIKRDGDRGHHYGWRNRDRKKIVIRHRGRDRDSNVGFRHRDEGVSKKVIIKRRSD
jgi:hypothetical protein